MINATRRCICFWYCIVIQLLLVYSFPFVPQILPLDPSQIEAVPRDLNDLEGCDGDLRVLPNLIDGENVTTVDQHMWLAPFTPGADHLLTIDFGKVTPVLGVRVWNYNKNPGDVDRGAR